MNLTQNKEYYAVFGLVRTLNLLGVIPYFLFEEAGDGKYYIYLRDMS